MCADERRHRQAAPEYQVINMAATAEDARVGVGVGVGVGQRDGGPGAADGEGLGLSVGEDEGRRRLPVPAHLEPPAATATPAEVGTRMRATGAVVVARLA
jgi:hypothetical protein